MAGQNGKKSLWRRLAAILGLTVAGAVLIGLAVYVRKTVDVGAVLGAMSPWAVGLAILAVPALETVDGLIFWSMGRRSGEDVTLSGCLAVSFIGELYYRLGPAGAPVQLGLMVGAGFTGTGAATVYTWKVVANTVVYGLYAVTALGAKLFLFREDLGWAVFPTAVLIAGYVAICAAVFFIAAKPRLSARLAEKVIRFFERRVAALRKEDRAGRACAKVREFCGQVGSVRGNYGLLGRMFLGMFAELTLLFSIPMILYFGLGLRGTSAAELLLTQCLVMVLSRVVLLPGNAGGAEGSFYLFFSGIFGPATGVAMVLWRLLTFAWPMALGAGFSVFRAARQPRRAKGT